MNKFKPVILTSVISAVVAAILGHWLFFGDWPFLLFLLLAGFFMAVVQKENKSYQYLGKLIIGSLIFGLLTVVLIFLRMYLVSHWLISDIHPIPFSFWIDKDNFAMMGVFSFISFLGGLAGITLKGFYTLYRDKLDKIILFIGPLLLTVASLMVSRVKIGGTIMSITYGWPYRLVIHQVKDVIDKFTMDKWIWSPGSLYHYVIFNYLFYFLILLAIFGLVKFLNQKISTKKFNSTFILFGILILGIISLTSYLSLRQAHISNEIANAGQCEQDEDCVIVTNKAPFSCAIVANQANAKRILRLVNSYPSTMEYQCYGVTRAECSQGKCQIADDTSQEANARLSYEQAMTKIQTDPQIKTKTEQAIRNFMNQSDLTFEYIDTQKHPSNFTIGMATSVGDGAIQIDTPKEWDRPVYVFQQQEYINDRCEVYEYEVSAEAFQIIEVHVRYPEEIQNLLSGHQGLNAAKCASYDSMELSLRPKSETEKTALDFLSRNVSDFKKIKPQLVYTSSKKGAVNPSANEWSWQNTDYKLPDGLTGDPFSSPTIRVIISSGGKLVYYFNSVELFE